jgi:hypothetical protein
MSRLENQTKPLLLPLIDGESRHLDPSDQRTLARWADKTAVVLETTSPKTVVSSQADRTRIMQEEDDPAPAQFSRVWIGRTDLPARLPASRARSVRVRDVVTGEVGGVRSDVLIVGHVVLYVVGATFPDLASIPSAVVALNDKLAQIWPIAHRTFSWPSASALSSDDIETLVASIHEDY